MSNTTTVITPLLINGDQLVGEMVLIVLFARCISWFFNYYKLPRIVGDMLAGVILGPSVLQDLSDVIFLPQNRDAMKMMGYIGLMLSSMSSGGNFDPRLMKGRVLKVVTFSTFNIFLTFGSAYGLVNFIPNNADFRNQSSIYNENSFNMYVACVLAATSLPMTFLIIDELKISHLSLSKFAIGASTVATIYLFTMVSVANALQKPDPVLGGPSTLIPFRLGMLVAVVVLLILVHFFWEWGLKKYDAEPMDPVSLKKKKYNWFNRTSTDLNLFIICLAFGVSASCDKLGYSYVLGAFIAGCLLPFNDSIRHEYAIAVKFVARWILLPMFFLYIGLEFDVRGLTAENWGVIFLCLAWGYVSKALCAPFAWFFLGFSWTDSCFLTSIANCRGFNALVVGVAAYNNGNGQFGRAMFATAVLFSITTSTFAGVLCKYFYSHSRIMQSEELALEEEAHREKEKTGGEINIVSFLKDDMRGIGFNVKLHIVDDLCAEGGLRTKAYSVINSHKKLFSGKAIVDYFVFVSKCKNREEALKVAEYMYNMSMIKQFNSITVTHEGKFFDSDKVLYRIVDGDQNLSIKEGNDVTLNLMTAAAYYYMYQQNLGEDEINAMTLKFGQEAHLDTVRVDTPIRDYEEEDMVGIELIKMTKAKRPSIVYIAPTNKKKSGITHISTKTGKTVYSNADIGKEYMTPYGEGVLVVVGESVVIRLPWGVLYQRFHVQEKVV